MNDAYQAGYTHAKYRFTYINPYWNEQDLQDYCRGWKDGGGMSKVTKAKKGDEPTQHFDKRDPLECPDPECGSDILSPGLAQAEDGYLYRRVVCLTCHRQWYEHYNFSFWSWDDEKATSAEILADALVCPRCGLERCICGE